MYSCTSLGVKIGGGIGTAVVGWMLEFSGYVGKNATQPQSARYDAVHVSLASVNL